MATGEKSRCSYFPPLVLDVLTHAMAMARVSPKREEATQLQTTMKLAMHVIRQLIQLMPFICVICAVKDFK